ncbi:Glycoprotein-N-acetylgalactosamine 3-beta-galactosyltransferase 1 [Frankliniella fusca]|uniref:N-acetylgalactosaminide beta-1,3-galactosyltransferase n=1 Tax=Frankliniella fusca TaxID=407009 RepID=A0AAE1GZB8_9NEOP|nr:Glycoprotein-N-acetylgalactosamine 3-beta-galactosyltransferase 1 [Frankliniella fusca]
MSSRRPMNVLFFGVVIGFFLGILVLRPTENVSPLPHPSRHISCDSSKKSGKLSGNYETWLTNQGILRKTLDFDEYLYGNSHKQAVLEAEFLKKKIHVLCVVFVEREKNIMAASHTWLRHCNDYVLYYAKRPQDHREKNFAEDLGVKKVQAKSSWDFLCKTVLDLWEKKESKLQWLLFVSDDMFVVPENLRRMVAQLDPNHPYYFGHAQTLWGQPFNVALAGYALSKGTVELLASNFTFDSCPTGGKYWKKEDFYLGKNLEKLCVLPSDTRDSAKKGRFHGYNLNKLLFSNKLALIASYWKDSIYPSTEGIQCCSDLSVTFQGIEADKMYMYDYIINRLRVFSHGIHGNQPASTPHPPEQVWKDFMRSRGYSSVENISSKQYINAWKAKINEDLIKAGFKKKKQVWRGMDFHGDGHGEAIPLPLPFQTVLDTE